MRFSAGGLGVAVADSSSPPVTWVSNATDPHCVQAVVIWQHGTYEILADGSITTDPSEFEADGRIQVQDACAATTSVISYYSQPGEYQSWIISVWRGKEMLQVRFFSFLSRAITDAGSCSSLLRSMDRSCRGCTALQTILRLTCTRTSHSGPSRPDLVASRFSDPPSLSQQFYQQSLRRIQLAWRIIVPPLARRIRRRSLLFSPPLIVPLDGRRISTTPRWTFYILPCANRHY